MSNMYPVGFRITRILTDFINMRKNFLGTYDQGEPAVNYRWTGWVWEITGWSSRLWKNYDQFRGIYNVYLNLVKENRRMWICNQLDLQTLGSQPVIPKNLPAHWRALVGTLMHERMISSSIAMKKEKKKILKKKKKEVAQCRPHYLQKQTNTSSGHLLCALYYYY